MHRWAPCKSQPSCDWNAHIEAVFFGALVHRWMLVYSTMDTLGIPLLDLVDKLPYPLLALRCAISSISIVTMAAAAKSMSLTKEDLLKHLALPSPTYTLMAVRLPHN